MIILGSHAEFVFEINTSSFDLSNTQKLKIRLRSVISGFHVFFEGVIYANPTMRPSLTRFQIFHFLLYNIFFRLTQQPHNRVCPTSGWQILEIPCETLFNQARREEYKLGIADSKWQMAGIQSTDANDILIYDV